MKHRSIEAIRSHRLPAEALATKAVANAIPPWPKRPDASSVKCVVVSIDVHCVHHLSHDVLALARWPRWPGWPGWPVALTSVDFVK